MTSSSTWKGNSYLLFYHFRYLLIKTIWVFYFRLNDLSIRYDCLVYSCLKPELHFRFQKRLFLLNPSYLSIFQHSFVNNSEDLLKALLIHDARFVRNIYYLI
mgnify:CR=1 FL=1